MPCMHALPGGLHGVDTPPEYIIARLSQMDDRPAAIVDERAREARTRTCPARATNSGGETHGVGGMLTYVTAPARTIALC